MTAPKPDLLDAIKALTDEWERTELGTMTRRHVASLRALLAGATTSETVEGDR